MAGDTTEELTANAQRYRFPDTTGAGQRIAIVEPRGGYIPTDLAAMAKAAGGYGTVVDHSVQAVCDGLPLNGENSPLAADRIGLILDDLARGSDAAATAKRFAADAEWSTFMATLETTLDIHVAATLAVDAQIDVWFTPYHPAGLAAGIVAAVDSGAASVSVSWGQSEADCLQTGQHNVDLVEHALERAVGAGVTVCCASGDYGSINTDTTRRTDVAVNYPASSPSALACGATMTADDSTEVVWNVVEYGLHHASGGGISGMFPRPSHQHTLTGLDMTDVWTASATARDFLGRAVPDVALNAGPYSIVLGGRPFAAGGTSAAAPMMAALLARVAESTGAATGFVGPAIYAASGRGFTDIVTGDDRVPGAKRVFSAASGWDACTGWGTPDGAALAAVLKTT